MPHMNGRQRKYKKKTKKGGSNLSSNISPTMASSPMEQPPIKNHSAKTHGMEQKKIKKMTSTSGLLPGLMSKIKMPSFKFPDYFKNMTNNVTKNNAGGGKRRRTRKKNRKNKKSKRRRRRKGSR